MSMEGASSDVRRKVPACQDACPAGVDIPRYVRHLRNREFVDALAVNREKIPFPSACGHVCVHPCEAACARKQLDEAVAIRLLKRAAAEKGRELWKDSGTRNPATGKKVVVVGSGPCGLTAAYYLARKGHSVTVKEALPEPGGMMRYGIPEYRLPRDVLAREVEDIMKAGVEVETSTRVESPSQLLDEGYDAVLVAIGTWRSSRLTIPGEESERVVDGLAFLRTINTGGSVDPGDSVIVVGGGNTAIDAARTAVRTGARHVTIFYRRTRDEMPASHEEIEGALSEGVKMEFLLSPVTVVDKGRVLELTCQHMELGKPDSSGRPRVSAIPDSEFTTTCDMVIVAVGQTPETGEAFGLSSGPGSLVMRDKMSLTTSKPGVFAAGDAAEGPTSIIEAIADGRRVASAVDRFLGGSGDMDESPVNLTSATREEAATRGTTRPYVRRLPLGDRRGSFAAVELGFEASAAIKEAHRCLGCDLLEFDVTVDAAACKECGYCEEVCKLGVYSPASFTNDRGYRPVVATRPERCIGCGDCIFACPDFAISVTERECVQ